MKKSFLAPVLVIFAQVVAAQPGNTADPASASVTVAVCHDSANSNGVATNNEESASSIDERTAMRVEVRQPNVASAARKLSYAMRIRFLVETWHLENDAALANRLRDAIKDLNTTQKATVCFAILAPLREATPPFIPSEPHLRGAYESLLLAYPGGPLPSAAAAQAFRLPSPGNIAYTFLQPVGSSLPTESIGGAGGISFQQAFIEAATAYLLDRARADLAYSGLRKLKRDVLGQELLETLMPTTYGYFKTLNPDGGTSRDPRLFLSSLQSTVGRDIVRLPLEIAEHRRDNVPEQNRARWAMAYHMLSLLNDLQDGQHPFVAVASRAQDVVKDSGAEQSRRMLELGVLASFMAELTDDAAGVYARHTLSLAEGRRLAAIFIAEELQYSEQLQSIEMRLTEARRILEELALEVNQLRERFAQVRAANPAQAAELYADLMVVAGRLVRHAAPSDGARGHLDTLLQIREAAVRRDYHRAVTETLKLLNNDELRGVFPLEDEHIPILLAAASLASAQNADDIYGVLISLAARPTSFEERRISGTLAISLNAYVGGSVGSERIPSLDADAGQSVEGHAGAFLPAGVEVTYSPSSIFGSVGVFVSLVNFGSAADYRLGAGSGVESAPSYQPESLISPGVYLTVGLTRSFPLTAGLGMSRVYGLRALEQGETANVLRASFFLAVDIPLARLYSSR